MASVDVRSAAELGRVPRLQIRVDRALTRGRARELAQAAQLEATTRRTSRSTALGEMATD